MQNGEINNNMVASLFPYETNAKQWKSSNKPLKIKVGTI